LKIAVVIPCRNEVLYIRECIEAIFNSKLEPEIEINVAVVDGMSDDGTREVINELKLQFPKLFIVDNVEKITPFAFNLGINSDQTVDYVQIVGARQILSANYIQDAVNVLKNDTSIWCVGGKVENVYVNEIGKIISLAMSTSFGMGLGNFRTLEKSGFTDTVGTPMYPFWVFEKIGLFDEELIRNQDDDFNFRIIQAGGKIFYNNDISLKYYVRGNYTGLWRQFFQYGYWKVYVNKKHKTVTTIRQLVPPLFIMFLILLVVLLFINLNLFLLGLIPLLIYILMGLSFAMKAAQKSNDIFYIIYGLGYLKGIL